MQKLVGKARATVSNSLRLLELPNEVRELIKQNELSMGHARALLGLDREQQARVAKTVMDKHLSVRQTEQLVRKLTQGKVAELQSKCPAERSQYPEFGE